MGISSSQLLTQVYRAALSARIKRLVNAETIINESYGVMKASWNWTGFTERGPFRRHMFRSAPAFRSLLLLDLAFGSRWVSLGFATFPF